MLLTPHGGEEKEEDKENNKNKQKRVSEKEKKDAVKIYHFLNSIRARLCWCCWGVNLI